MRHYFFSLKNSTSFRHYMLKYYNIFRIAWKFLAKFVILCLKKLYYTAFFSKIFRQDFSLIFDIIQRQTTTFFASPGFRCRNMSKKIVIFCRFDKIIQSFSTCARVIMVSKNDGERCLSNDVKFLVCRKLVLKNVYKNF